MRGPAPGRRQIPEARQLLLERVGAAALQAGLAGRLQKQPRPLLNAARPKPDSWGTSADTACARASSPKVAAKASPCPTLMAMTEHRSVARVIGYFQAGGVADNSAAQLLENEE